MIFCFLSKGISCATEGPPRDGNECGPYSADCWRNENLPYRGLGEGGVVRISVIADQVLYHDQT